MQSTVKFCTQLWILHTLKQIICFFPAILWITGTIFQTSLKKNKIVTLILVMHVFSYCRVLFVCAVLSPFYKTTLSAMKRWPYQRETIYKFSSISVQPTSGLIREGAFGETGDYCTISDSCHYQLIIKLKKIWSIYLPAVLTDLFHFISYSYDVVTLLMEKFNLSQLKQM